MVFKDRYDWMSDHHAASKHASMIPVVNKKIETDLQF